MSRDPVEEALDGPGEQGNLFDATARLKLDLNDRGNAKRLLFALKGSAIHVVGRGWAVWNGRKYDFEGGASRMLAKAAECLPRLIEEEAAAQKGQPVSEARIAEVMAEKGLDRDKAEQKAKASRSASRKTFGLACGNVSRLRAAVDLAVADFLVDGSLLDADRTVINLANGTLNLRRIADVPEAEDPDEKAGRWGAALRPHDRDVLPTRTAGAVFDPEAAAPEWHRFLHLIMPDLEDRAYLKRCLGMLLGGRQGEVWFILLGPGGNGKSVVTMAIEAVLGDYAQPCRVEMFLENRNSGGTGPTPEEAVLPGARVYLGPEPRPNSVLDAGKMKGLTGGDRRQANPKNKDVFNYTPVGVPVLQANKMPIVNDASEGFWRRVFPVLFSVSLHELPEEEQRDRAFMEAAVEAEAPGILNWMLEGYAEFRDIGLAPPRKVLALKNSLRALADPVGQFLAEKTRRGSALRVKTSDLHKAFVAWVEAEGDKPMGAKAFTAAMLALDYDRFKDNHWFWRGLELTDTDLLGGSEGGP